MILNHEDNPYVSYSFCVELLIIVFPPFTLKGDLVVDSLGILL